MAEKHTVYHPHINVERLPEAERGHGQLLNNLIDNIDYHVRAFSAAVTLYEFATAESEKQHFEELKRRALPPRRSDMFDAWRKVAGRDGAMTLYHFQRTFEGITIALKRCPTVNALADRRSLSEGRKTFVKRFPHVTLMRHSLAHLAETASKIDAWETHAFRGDYQGPTIGFKDETVVILDEFQGNVFTTTYKKKILTYALSEESLDHLRLSGETIWRAFHEPTIKLTLTPA